MNQKPLKKGQVYEQLPNGEFIPVDAAKDSVTSVPVEDLPPDLRPEAAKMPQPVEVKPSEQTSNSKVSTRKAKKSSEPKKAETIIDDMQTRLNEGKVKLEEALKPKITEADRYAFLRAVVANKPFKKEYTLLDDKLKVIFRTVTAAEAEAVTEAIVIQSGRVPYSNLVAMSAAHFKYSMTCAISEMTTTTDEGIVIKKFESPLTLYSEEPRKSSYYLKENGELKLKETLLHAVPGQKVLWAAVDHFADINIVIYNMLFKCFQQFDALVAAMAKEAAEPNFFPHGVNGR